MFIKNYLTTNANNLLLEIFVTSVKPARLADVMISTPHSVGEKNPFILADKGVFFTSPKSNKTFYGSTKNSRQKKTSSEKLLIKKTHWKTIKLILTQILETVKEKFVDTFFKPITRDFTLQDLELVQKLLDKNKLDYPKAWAEFYKITGTNKNTFNN